MTGYAYGQHEPTENCPYCKTPCRADFVDIGVGHQQCGPFHCEQCGASEIGPYDEPRELTGAEKSTGWYAPESEPGSSANVIGGKIVSHVQMNRAYRDKFVGSMLYEWPGEVERWHEEIRKPCTGSDVAAFWANVQNAENCRRIARLIEALDDQPIFETMTEEELLRGLDHITCVVGTTPEAGK